MGAAPHQSSGERGKHTKTSGEEPAVLFEKLKAKSINTYRRQGIEELLKKKR
jgi:hypothetical protein